MEIGIEIKINSLGLEGNGSNNNFDENNQGLVRFGSGPVNLTKRSSIDETNAIDFHLNEEESIEIHHFNIRYDTLSKFYYIKNVNNSALFVKIRSKQVRVIYIN